uniref:Ciliary microtubule inner protein 2C n=1 Tax=Clastoptera arizonana TaxID=38151 RepID=A0A1B6C8M6_9HEMI
MGGQKPSTTHYDFPPKAIEPFLGIYAPIKHNYGSLYEQESTNFFQDYRNETLSRFTMAAYKYGFTRTPYSPKPDLVSAYKKANWKRILETPNVKLRLIDEARSQEVDNFYKNLF